MISRQVLEFRTRSRGTLDITAEVGRVVAASGIRTGLCTAFVQHTTLGLLRDVVVAIAHTETGSTIRVISMRKATKNEAVIYFENI